MRSRREALSLTSPTADVEFKRRFDSSSDADWSELVRDAVAMANSGGGLVVVGLEGDGSPAPDSGERPAIDPAGIDGEVHRYTGSHLSGVRVVRDQKDGRPVVVIEIDAVAYPLVFVRPGASFGAGTIYFRHGARTEGGTVDDLRMAFEREVTRRTEGWMENFRRIVEAAPGAVVSVTMPSRLAAEKDAGVAVRLVADPHATAVPRWSPDETHPHRLKDVVAIVHSRLGGDVRINSFDVRCVRHAFETDRDASFFYRPKLGTPQYSDAFVDWLVHQYRMNPSFFAEARAKFPKRRRQAAVAEGRG